MAERTIGDQVNLFLADCENGTLSARNRPYSAKSIKTYREGLGVFVRLAPRLQFESDLRRLGASHLQRYAQELRDAGARETTVAARLNVLGPFLTWCVTKGYITQSPFLLMKRPRATARKVIPFTADEIQTLIDACDADSWLGARDRAIVWTLLDTGLREAEIVRLDLADLSNDSRQLHVHGKGGKERLARLGNNAKAAMDKWIVDWRGGSPAALFPGRYGKRLAPDAVWEIVRRVARTTGVQDVHPHRFRHTFAIQFLRAGGDPLRLQILLGHTTLEMTRRYVQALDEQDALSAHEFASPGDTMGLRAPRGRRSA